MFGSGADVVDRWPVGLTPKGFRFCLNKNLGFSGDSWKTFSHLKRVFSSQANGFLYVSL